MKGKLKVLLLGLLCALLTTGCVKHNVTMSVKDDNSVTLEMIYGIELDSSLMDDEDTNTEDSGVDPEDYKFLESAGYKVEPFTETKDDGAKLSGVKVTKTFDNIDDITSDKEDKVNLVSIFDEENKNLNDIKFFYKDGKEYVSNFYFDYESGEDEMDMSSMESMFDLKYTLNLPKKATENNATKVSDDGKEYTWELKYSEKNDINVKFKTGSSLSSNTTMYIIIAVAAVAVIGVVVTIIVVSSKKKTNNNISTTATEESAEKNE